LVVAPAAAELGAKPSVKPRLVVLSRASSIDTIEKSLLA